MKHLEDKEYIRQLFPLVDQIKDSSIRDKVIETWRRTWSESKWERIESVPANAEIQVDKCSIVQHTNYIAAIALHIGHVIHDDFNLPLDFDVLLAGALLHDVSTINEFEPDGKGGEKITDIGSKITHAAYGAGIALNVGLPLDVVHIIVSHTPLAATMPSSFEALIVSYVDLLICDVFFLTTGAKLFLEAQKKYRRKSVLCPIGD